MTDAARTLTAPTGAYTLILPGTWSLIQFGDDEAIKQRVQAIVKQRVGRADRLARTRRSVADELTQTAIKARDGGAHAMYLSMEIMPGIPFPAAIVTADIPWPIAGGERPMDDVESALAAAYPAAAVVRHRMGPVARVTDAGMRRIGDQETPAFNAEYWIPYADGRALLDVIISAPMASDAELFGMLFDAIVDSLTWKE